MSRNKLRTAATVCLSVMVAGGVFAEDPKAERRQKLRKLGETAAGIAAGIVEDQIEQGIAAEAEMVAGNVIVLGKPGTEAKEINNGCLVVVRVPDSGSRPSQDIVVEAGQAFQRLGQVRGVAQKNGKQQTGGGYTWILLKPVTEGESSVIVRFTPNGGGKAVKREFKVTVTAAEAEYAQGE